MFTVYSKEDCIWCTRAYAFLELKGVPYRSEPIDTDEKRQAFIARGFRQFPQIFYNDELIGGFDKLENWYKDHFVEGSVWEDDFN